MDHRPDIAIDFAELDGQADGVRAGKLKDPGSAPSHEDVSARQSTTSKDLSPVRSGSAFSGSASRASNTPSKPMSRTSEDIGTSKEDIHASDQRHEVRTRVRVRGQRFKVIPQHGTFTPSGSSKPAPERNPPSSPRKLERGAIDTTSYVSERSPLARGRLEQVAGSNSRVRPGIARDFNRSISDLQASGPTQSPALVLVDEIQMNAGQVCRFAIDRTEEDGRITRQFYSIPFDPEISEQLKEPMTRQPRRRSDLFGIAKQDVHGLNTLPQFEELPSRPPKDQKLLEQAYLALHRRLEALSQRPIKNTLVSDATDSQTSFLAGFGDTMDRDSSFLFNIRQQTSDDFETDARERGSNIPTSRSTGGNFLTTPEAEHMEASMYMKSTGSREIHNLRSVQNQLSEALKAHEKYVKESKVTHVRLQQDLEAERKKYKDLEQKVSIPQPDQVQRGKLEQKILQIETREEELNNLVNLYRHQRDMLLDGTTKVKQDVRATRDEMRKQDVDMQRRHEWAEYTQAHQPSNSESDLTPADVLTRERFQDSVELQSSLGKLPEEDQISLHAKHNAVLPTDPEKDSKEDVRATSTLEMPATRRAHGVDSTELVSRAYCGTGPSTSLKQDGTDRTKFTSSSLLKSMRTKSATREKGTSSYTRSEPATPRTGHFSLPPDLQDIGILPAMYQELEKEPFQCDHLAELLYSIATIDSRGQERRLLKKHKFYVSSRSSPLWPARTLEPWEDCYILLPRDAVVLLCPHGHPYTSRFYWAVKTRRAYSDSPDNVHLPSSVELSVDRGDLLEYAHGECIYAHHGDDRVYCCVKTQSGKSKGFVPNEVLVEAEDTMLMHAQRTFCHCVDAQPYTGRAVLLQDVPGTTLKRDDLLDIAHRTERNPAVYCVKSRRTQVQAQVHSRHLEMLRNPLRWVESYGEEETNLPLTARGFDIDETAWIVGEEKTVEEEISKYNARMRKFGKPGFSDEAVLEEMRRIDRQDKTFPTFSSSRRKWHFWSAKQGGVPDMTGSFWHEPRELVALPAPLADTLPGQSMQPSKRHARARAWSLVDRSRTDVYKHVSGVGAVHLGDLRSSVQHTDGRTTKTHHGESIDDTQSEPDIRAIEGLPRGRFPISINRRYLYEKEDGRYVCRSARTSYDVREWPFWVQNGGTVEPLQRDLTYSKSKAVRDRSITASLRVTPFPWGAEYLHLDNRWPAPYGPRVHPTDEARDRTFTRPQESDNTDIDQERQKLLYAINDDSNLDQVYLVTTNGYGYPNTSRSLRGGDIVSIVPAISPESTREEHDIFVEQVWDISQLQLVYGGQQYKTRLDCLDWQSPMLRTAVLAYEPQKQVILLKRQPRNSKWLCLIDKELRTIASEDLEIEDPQHWQLFSDLDYDLRQATERVNFGAPNTCPPFAEWRWLYETVQEPRASDGPDLDVEVGEFVHVHHGQNPDAPVLFCSDVRYDNQGWVDTDAIDLDSEDRFLPIFSAERPEILPKGCKVILLGAKDDYIYCACEDLSKRWFDRWDLQLSEDYQVVDLRKLLELGLLVLPTPQQSRRTTIENVTESSQSSSLSTDTSTKRAIDALIAQLKSDGAGRTSSVDAFAKHERSIPVNGKGLHEEAERQTSVGTSVLSVGTQDVAPLAGLRNQQPTYTLNEEDHKGDGQHNRTSGRESNSETPDTATQERGPPVTKRSPANDDKMNAQAERSTEVVHSHSDQSRGNWSLRLGPVKTTMNTKSITGASGPEDGASELYNSGDVPRQGNSHGTHEQNTEDAQARPAPLSSEAVSNQFLGQVPPINRVTDQRTTVNSNPDVDNEPGDRVCNTECCDESDYNDDDSATDSSAAADAATDDGTTRDAPTTNAMYAGAFDTKAIISSSNSWDHSHAGDQDSQDHGASTGTEQYASGSVSIRQRVAGTTTKVPIARATQSRIEGQPSSKKKRFSRSKLPPIQTRLPTKFSGARLMPLQLSGGGVELSRADESTVVQMAEFLKKGTDLPTGNTQDISTGKQKLVASDDEHTDTQNEAKSHISSDSVTDGRTEPIPSERRIATAEEHPEYASSSRPASDTSNSWPSWFFAQFFANRPIAEHELKTGGGHNDDGKETWPAASLGTSAVDHRALSCETSLPIARAEQVGFSDGPNYASIEIDDEDEQLERFMRRFRSKTRSNTSQPARSAASPVVKSANMEKHSAADEQPSTTHPPSSADSPPQSASNPYTTNRATNPIAEPCLSNPTSTPQLSKPIRRLHTSTLLLLPLLLLNLYLLLTLLRARTHWLSPNNPHPFTSALNTRIYTHSGRWLWTWLGQEGSGTWLEGVLWEYGVVF